MYIDIGANLTDPSFQGIYRGRKLHRADLEDVINRAKHAGIAKLIITAGCLEELREALYICDRYDVKGDFLFTTAGVHPTRCNELNSDSEGYLNQMIQLANSRPGRVVAIGELGLDFDRLQFCDMHVQKRGFEKQLGILPDALDLPLFLHMRNACDAFQEIVSKFKHLSLKGVVHSFTGTPQEASCILNLGFDIGINGCSLKTAENLATVKTIPLNRLHFETDAPWCGVRSTHAAGNIVGSSPHTEKKPEKWEPGCYVKGRNEPSLIGRVARIVSHVHTGSEHLSEPLVSRVFQNSLYLFRLNRNPSSDNDLGAESDTEHTH